MANAERKVARLVKALTESNAAVHAWQSAIAAEQSAAYAADTYGGLRAANPTNEGRIAIDRHRAAEATVRESHADMLDTRRRFLAAVSKMTKFDPFGLEVDDDSDLGDDDDPPAATPPTPLDWRAAVGVADTISD